MLFWKINGPYSKHREKSVMYYVGRIKSCWMLKKVVHIVTIELLMAVNDHIVFSFWFWLYYNQKLIFSKWCSYCLFTVKYCVRGTYTAVCTK